MALRKKTGTAVANWDDQLAALADVAVQTEESVALGQFISVRAGQMSVDGNPVPDNRMNVVVIDHILENAYYEGRFDADNPTAPVCFAFGRKEEELAPHPLSAKPQNETCKGCELNEFASADTGRGKACKNIRRLALMPQDDLDDIQNAQVRYFKIPVTSVRPWAAFVQNVGKTLRKPPFGVVTEIASFPDPKTQVKVTFKVVEEITDMNTIGELIEKNKLVASEIDFPYQFTEREEEAPRKRSGLQKPTPKRVVGRR